MDMSTRQEIEEAGLTDWRKLGQGLHARYRTAGFSQTVALLGALAETAREHGHAPRATIDGSYLDLKLISTDAVYRDSEGAEHTVDWVTRRDLDLAQAMTTVAAEHGAVSAPETITAFELALDTPDSSRIAPFWSALLTGSGEALGRGTLGDDVRDDSGQTPILWFQDTDAHETPRQRFHLDIWVPAEMAPERISAALAAGGSLVDDSSAPSFTILADADGNRACVCTWLDPD